MEFNVIFDKQSNLVVCEVTGSLTLGNIRTAIEAILTKCNETHCWSVLIEGRKAVMEMDLADFTYLSAMTGNFELDPCFKQAFVVKEKTFDLEFYEKMRQAHGTAFRVFDDIEEAKKWLSTC